MLAVLSIFIVGANNTAISVLLLIFLLLIIFDSLNNNCCRFLQWQADGYWLVNDNVTAILQVGSVVTPFFSVLNFKLENNKKLHVVLFKDNIDVEKFRRLRVRMKVEGIQLKDHDKLS